MSTQINPEHDGRYGWYVLIVLSLVNMMNYMDRMLLSVLLPEIRRDIALNDTQLGLLTGFAFAIFYASFGLPLARLADVWVRRNIISIALIFWSLMTAAAGTAQTFSHLLLARIGLAIGEAGCIPPSHSLISDYVPAERRPSAFAIYTAGATAGIIAGLALGGVLSSLIGWRLIPVSEEKASPTSDLRDLHGYVAELKVSEGSAATGQKVSDLDEAVD